MSIPPPPPRRRTPSPTPNPPPPDPEARAARRAEEGSATGRRPPLLLVAAVLVALALVGVGVVVLSGGGKNGPALNESTSVKLQLGDLAVEAVNPFNGKPENFPTETSDAALALVKSYVHEATVVPLRAGTAKDTDLAAVFDDAALARLASGDREALVDEHRPKAVGKLTVQGAPVALTALMDSNSAIVLVTAAIDLDIKAQAARGAITVKRTGTLVLSPQADGSWKITAWTLHVERGGRGVAATPTDSTTTTVAT